MIMGSWFSFPYFIQNLLGRPVDRQLKWQPNFFLIISGHLPVTLVTRRGCARAFTRPGSARTATAASSFTASTKWSSRPGARTRGLRLGTRPKDRTFRTPAPRMCRRLKAGKTSTLSGSIPVRAFPLMPATEAPKNAERRLWCFHANAAHSFPLLKLIFLALWLFLFDLLLRFHFLALHCRLLNSPSRL